MIIGICPKCADYNVLQVKSLSCGSTICLCENCSSSLNEEDLKPKKMSGFATMLANTAQNLADKGDLYALNALKLEARKAKEDAQKTYYDQVTKPINDILLEARKSGATDEQLQAI